MANDTVSSKEIQLLNAVLSGDRRSRSSVATGVGTSVSSTLAPDLVELLVHAFMRGAQNCPSPSPLSCIISVWIEYQRKYQEATRNAVGTNE